MSFVKWISCLLLPFILLVGCQSTQEISSFDRWMEDSGHLKVLSTTAMIDDLVHEIGGDEIEHLALITGEIDPHSYELVKGDGEKIARADIVFCNGLGLEHGASIREMIAHHPCAILLGDYLSLHEPERLVFVDNHPDPHFWMDIALWSETIPAIVTALSEKLPEKASIFHERGDLLRKNMLVVHEEIRSLLHQIPEEQRYLVTSHDAFNYFSRAYLCDQRDEQRCAAPEGLAPDGQLSSFDIRRIIDHLCLHQIHVVFSESNVSRESLKKIVSSCEKLGHRVSICTDPLYGDSMGKAANYLEMMQHNALTIKHAWESYEP